MTPLKTCAGKWMASVFAALVLATSSFAQSPAPPSDLIAIDHPWDNGTRIDLTWMPSPDDASLQGYIVREKAVDAQEFSRVDIVPKGTTRYTVANLDHTKTYLFQVAAVAPDNAESPPAVTTTPVQPKIEWFDGTRFWFLIVLLIFSGAVIAYISIARRGVQLKVRPIPGLKAVDE